MTTQCCSSWPVCHNTLPFVSTIPWNPLMLHSRSYEMISWICFLSNRLSGYVFQGKGWKKGKVGNEPRRNPGIFAGKWWCARTCTAVQLVTELKCSLIPAPRSGWVLLWKHQFPFLFLKLSGQERVKSQYTSKEVASLSGNNTLKPYTTFSIGELEGLVYVSHFKASSVFLGFTAGAHISSVMHNIGLVGYNLKRGRLQHISYK